MRPELAPDKAEALLRVLERELEVQPRNVAMLAQALTHRSVGSRNYERLEFLGDAVLGLVVAEALFTIEPPLSEGALTRARAKVVKRESLAVAARRIGLGQFLLLGPGELRSGGRERDSILADATEALLGVIYLELGLDAARRAVRRLMQPELDGARSGVQKDPKTALQELLQARALPLPEYSVLSVTGAQHAQNFDVQCNVDALALVVSASGGSRRQAEQAAAERALNTIEEQRL